MKLERWIEANGHDEAAFAVLIGTTEMAVRRYCRGDRIPAKEQMQRIWQATNGDVTPNDFYGLDARGRDTEARGAA